MEIFQSIFGLHICVKMLIEACRGIPWANIPFDIPMSRPCRKGCILGRFGDGVISNVLTFCGLLSTYANEMWCHPVVTYMSSSHGLWKQLTWSTNQKIIYCYYCFTKIKSNLNHLLYHHPLPLMMKTYSGLTNPVIKRKMTKQNVKFAKCLNSAKDAAECTRVWSKIMC